MFGELEVWLARALRQQMMEQGEQEEKESPQETARCECVPRS